MRVVASLVFVCAFACLAFPAFANGGKKSAAAPPPPAQTSCNGTFSNGAKITVTNAVYMPDVGYIGSSTPLIGANAQTACDLHTFAWNQFLYWTQGGTTPRFMTMAPWYNALTTGAKPGAYPGGSTSLQTAYLSFDQAGDQDELLDVSGNPVRYDIRFDQNMYQSIVLQNLYSLAGYNSVCQPQASNNNLCKNNNIWMIPVGANENPEPGSTEIKTAWRDFLTPAACPTSQYFCQGRFGLVGFHFVNKTFSHGEWIWASFEHVSNAPDCGPGGDTPIAQSGPAGNWSFFNPSTVPPGVMSSKMCSVVSPSPQCNTNPNPSGDGRTWVQANICRTDLIAGGGVSSANCNPTSGNNPGNVACLNATILPQLSGVWKNYKLVGTVWTSPSQGPNNDFRIQVFQNNTNPPFPANQYPAPAGFVHLANTSIETWLQMGATGYDPDGNNATQAGCFACHHEPSSATQVDMSHFPGKLPAPTLQALKASLIAANSSAKPVALVSPGKKNQVKSKSH